MQKNGLVFGGLALLGLSLVFAACNNGNGSTGEDLSVCKEVKTPGFLYSPNAITIKKGGCINFESSSFHPLFPTSGSNNPIPERPTSTVKVVFNETGTFGFRCANHDMIGTVTVE